MSGPQVDGLDGVGLARIGDGTDDAQIHALPTGHKEVIVWGHGIAVFVVLDAMPAIGLDPLEVECDQVGTGQLARAQSALDIVDRRLSYMEFAVSWGGFFQWILLD